MNSSIRFGTNPSCSVLLGEAVELGGYEEIVERAKRARAERLRALRAQGAAGGELEVDLTAQDMCDGADIGSVYIPPDEIAARAAAIRAGWSDEERQRRAGALAPTEVKVCEAKDPNFARDLRRWAP